MLKGKIVQSIQCLYADLLLDVNAGEIPMYAANVSLGNNIMLLWGADLLKNASETEDFCQKYGAAMANITAAGTNLAVGRTIQVLRSTGNGTDQDVCLFSSVP